MNKENNQLITKFLKDFSKDPNFKFFKKLQKKFTNSNFYLVGGKVRDILLERESADYDFVIQSTKAKDMERELKKLGTVNLVGKSFGVFKFIPKNSKLNEAIDIALPRTEHSFNTGGYRDFDIQSDPELPIEKDLERRDFTINAMALDLKNKKLIDPFNGQTDLKNKLIRTVGDPKQRFAEDYTRMLRAIRFSVQLFFKIEPETYKNIYDLRKNIKTIPTERITEEFNKIIMSPNAEFGVQLLQKSGLLKQFIPELEEGVGVSQNRHHIYEVFEHNVKALNAAAKRDYELTVRLAALFHDIAKPETKAGEGLDSTFYNHDIVGAKKVKKILQRLKYSNDIIDKVSHLVRHHMFFYSMEGIGDSAIRRLLNRVGPDSIKELIQLRICDRLGMDRPKAKPYKLIQLERRLQIVQMDPINVKMLKINGDDIKELLNLKPGVRYKYLLEALLSEVLENPKKNDRKKLIKRLKELNKFSEEELKKLAPDFEKLETERKKAYFKKYKFVE